MSEISIFVDESGGQDGHSKYYVLTLVFHNQSLSIEEQLHEHKRGLAIRGFADIPFHAGPILTGHDDYEHALGSRQDSGRFPRAGARAPHLP